MLEKDMLVKHPPHYTEHPSGVECIQITEHLNFNMGNAIKYIWRCDLKNDPIQNIDKAIWYLEREKQRRLNFGNTDYKKEKVQIKEGCCGLGQETKNEIISWNTGEMGNQCDNK